MVIDLSADGFLDGCILQVRDVRARRIRIVGRFTNIIHVVVCRVDKWILDVAGADIFRILAVSILARAGARLNCRKAVVVVCLEVGGCVRDDLPVGVVVAVVNVRLLLDGRVEPPVIDPQRNQVDLLALS